MAVRRRRLKKTRNGGPSARRISAQSAITITGLMHNCSFCTFDEANPDDQTGYFSLMVRCPDLAAEGCISPHITLAKVVGRLEMNVFDNAQIFLEGKLAEFEETYGFPEALWLRPRHLCPEREVGEWGWAAVVLSHGMLKVWIQQITTELVAILRQDLDGHVDSMVDYLHISVTVRPP